jgi:hypothetical protein
MHARSVEPVDTEKALATAQPLLFGAAAGTSGIHCYRSRSPRPIPTGPAQHSRRHDPEGTTFNALADASNCGNRDTAPSVIRAFGRHQNELIGRGEP